MIKMGFKSSEEDTRYCFTSSYQVEHCRSDDDASMSLVVLVIPDHYLLPDLPTNASVGQ